MNDFNKGSISFEIANSNIYAPSIARILLIFFIPILLIGCSESKENKELKLNRALVENQWKETLSGVDSLNSDPVVKAEKIIDLYLKEQMDVRSIVYQPVFAKLFTIAYTNADTSALVFFRQQAGANPDFPKIAIEALFNIASYELHVMRDTERGMNTLTQVKKHIGHFNDSIYKTYYGLYAQTMFQKGDMKKASDLYLKAIKLSEKLKDSTRMISNYGNLSAVYAQMNENHKAIKLTMKCMDYFLSKNDSISTLVSYVSLGRSFATIGNSDSSFIFYDKALQLIKESGPNPSVEVILYSNLGQIYAERNEFDQSGFYYDLCKKTLHELGSEEQNRIFIIFSALAYAHLRNVNEEIKAIENNIPAFAQNNDLINVRASYSTLYEIAALQKNADRALKYYKLYDSIDDLLASNANKKYTLELQTKYETERKEVKIQVQEKELTKKAAFNNVLLLFVVIAGISVAFFITRSRLQGKRKEAFMLQQFTSGLLSRTEEERERIARDLHDGLGQELLILRNQIRGGFKIVPEKIDQILNEVRTISRNIHPVMLDQIGLKESILHICNQISETEKIFIATNIDFKVNLSKNKELQLFRIIQEGLNNIIKYSSAEAAKLEIIEKNQKLVVLIQDNGKGFDVAATLKGNAAFGLLSILERSKAIHGNASLFSDEKGTIITIEIPIDNHG